MDSEDDKKQKPTSRLGKKEPSNLKSRSKLKELKNKEGAGESGSAQDGEGGIQSKGEDSASPEPGER